MSALGANIEKVPADLLDQPLDYILTDHGRQRTVMALLDQMMKGASNWQEIADELVADISVEMKHHVQDEEEDLFPLLRRRCRPEDEIDTVLSRLSHEHKKSERLAILIVEQLRDCVDQGNPPWKSEELQTMVSEFTGAERLHLALENSVILRLARARLTIGDLSLLSANMIARRAPTRC